MTLASRRRPHVCALYVGLPEDEGSGPLEDDVIIHIISILATIVSLKPRRAAQLLA